jgi:hypothetical protein
MEKQELKEKLQPYFYSIEEMVTALNEAREKDNEEALEEAERVIQEDPLSIQVRSGWQDIGEPLEPSEYEILLCWGGPAVRIVGELNEYHEPETANIEFQDWGISWEGCYFDDDILLQYARQFYFGE